MASVSVRIVDADYYLDGPLPNFDSCYSGLNQNKVSKVPVIRIFGSTPRGQKTCLHVHGVMPYFYVPVPNVDDKIKFSKNFIQSLEFAINSSLGKSASQQQQYVHMVEFVTKLPFYGYYAREIEFLKIQLYNPRLISKASELLLNGAVMNQFFQPYETHIPYLLQFFIDYNLHGMNLIHLAKVKFREPLPKGNANDLMTTSPCRSPLGSPKYSQTNYDIFNDVTVLSDLTLHNLIKQSACALEVDALGTDILNKHSIKGNLGANPGLNAIWEDEKMRRREKAESSIIEMPESQERSRYEITSNERLKLQQLMQMLFDRKSRNESQLDGEESLSLIQESLESSFSTNQSSQSLNSGDENLIDILVDMAEGEDNTPLVETTFINNGLDDDQENNTEDDEDVETLIMSQTVNNFDEIEIPDPCFRSPDDNGVFQDNSWSETFIGHIPQLDGQFDHIPQLDGNSDWTGSESSTEDFKLSSKRRVSKTYRQRKVRSTPNQDFINRLKNNGEKSVSSQSESGKLEIENHCGSFSKSSRGLEHDLKSFTNNEPLAFNQTISNFDKDVHKLKSPQRKRRKLSLEMKSDQSVQTQPLLREEPPVQKKYPIRTKSLPKGFFSEVSNVNDKYKRTFKVGQNRNLIKRKYNIKNVQVVITDIMEKDFPIANHQKVGKILTETPKIKINDHSTLFNREPYEPMYYDSLSALSFGSPKNDATTFQNDKMLFHSPSEASENETCTVVLESPNELVGSPLFSFQSDKEKLGNTVILPHCDVSLDHTSSTHSKHKLPKKSSSSVADESNLHRHNITENLCLNENEPVGMKKNINSPRPNTSSSSTSEINASVEEESINTPDLIKVNCNKSIESNSISQSPADAPLADLDSETLCHTEFDIIVDTSQKERKCKEEFFHETDDASECQNSVVEEFNMSQKNNDFKRINYNEKNFIVSKVNSTESSPDSPTSDDSNAVKSPSQYQPKPHFQAELKPCDTSLPLMLDVSMQSDASIDLISPPLFENESSLPKSLSNSAEDNPTENIPECSDYLRDDSQRSLSLLSTGSENEEVRNVINDQVDKHWVCTDSKIEEESGTGMDVSNKKELLRKSPCGLSGKRLENVFEIKHAAKPLSGRIKNTTALLTPLALPPTRKQIMDSLVHYGFHEVKYQGAFFSKIEDNPSTISEFHGASSLLKDTAKKGNWKPCGALQFFQRRQLQKLHGFCANSDDVSSELLPELQNMIIGNNDIVITPSKLPPCPEDIRYSLKSVEVPENQNASKIKNAENQTERVACCEKEKKQKSLHLFSPISSQQRNTASNATHYSTPGISDERKKSNSAYVKLDDVVNLPKLHNRATAKVELKFQSPKERFNASDIEGVTPNNTFGFDVTQQNLQDAKALHVNQHLTLVSVELHITTRRQMKPDPSMDPIACIFYFIHADASQQDNMDNLQRIGVFLHESKDSNLHSSNRQQNLKIGFGCYEVNRYESEVEMLLEFATFIQNLDPDILLGYEVQMLSWGYLIERAATLDINMCHGLSRILEGQQNPFTSGSRKSLNVTSVYDESLPMSITGRIILNVWRVMRSEVTLRRYTFENVAYHVLHQRFPSFSFESLSDWWNCCTTRWRVYQHYFTRCKGSFSLLDQIDFINRTSELARVFGILFYSVISRGSQFRVESMMLRVAKPLGFIPVSPNFQQISKMAAPECIPLVMEPESKFYVDPVIVLDFQSLYPSIIIAYNYCYSTCLGRVQSFGLNEEYRFGATSLKLPFSKLKKLSSQENIHISPNNVGFVTSNVRKGILPRMLEEILNTRIMVKGAMKKAKDDKTLHRMLDSRQLGLKLIANVTYGYTSANYSGRMPCIEIGDSVVRKGRETLERAIELVNSTSKWNARVVYGDTDSLFVLLKGASKERAFTVAKEIVDEVTALNPKPIKLKFEKVYQPCVLMTKKRYVGYMYESLDQKEPVFDAKGIETVRRDNCPAVSKVVEKSLRILFETKDISLVKSYVQKQFVKIMEGNVTMQDFIFGKEYRGMQNYKPGACVPALALARRTLKLDRRSEPRIGERVPYVIIHGSPGLPLIQLVKSPLEVISNSTFRLNDIYYITKQICPALDRIFSLLSVNVHLWYTDLPRVARIHDSELSKNSKKGSIAQYFRSSHCPICEELTMQRICSTCRNNPQKTMFLLMSRIRKVEKRFINLMMLCNHCTGTRISKTDCLSLDCPVFFKLSNVKGDFSRTDTFRDLIKEFDW